MEPFTAKTVFRSNFLNKITFGIRVHMLELIKRLTVIAIYWRLHLYNLRR